MSPPTKQARHNRPIQTNSRSSNRHCPLSVSDREIRLPPSRLGSDLLVSDATLLRIQIKPSLIEVLVNNPIDWHYRKCRQLEGRDAIGDCTDCRKSMLMRSVYTDACRDTFA